MVTVLFGGHDYRGAINSLMCSPTRVDHFPMQPSHPPHSWEAKQSPRRQTLHLRSQPPLPKRTLVEKTNKYNTAFQDRSYSSDPPPTLIPLRHTSPNLIGRASAATSPWRDHLFPASTRGPAPTKRVSWLTSYDQPTLTYALVNAIYQCDYRIHWHWILPKQQSMPGPCLLRTLMR